ncbi:protein-disulfide reductase DsbD family protein [Planctomicrobium sp. SH661]|uniref:protein-disulfide reductase DsbD family protein n=1 Tax=Planctomicrobium sp. SH661 TaxID=3448124 RepID=UPI003F5B80CB
MDRLLWCLVFISGMTFNLSAQEVGTETPGLDFFESDLGLAEGASDGVEPEVSATLVPTGRPNEVQLQIKLILPDGVNSYSLDDGFSKPTQIVLKAAGWKEVDSSFNIHPAPEREFDHTFDREVEKLYGTVTFSKRLIIPPGTAIESAVLHGSIDYLYCDRDLCQPALQEFSAKVQTADIGHYKPAGNAPSDTPTPEEVSPSTAQSLVKTHPSESPDSSGAKAESRSAASGDFVLDETAGSSTFAAELLTSFIAGVLMNILPCVLPVLAIKILSFVQQAGESRTRILALNLSYTAGVLTVFLVLATLSVVLGQSLASLYQNVWFMIVMTCIVVTLALSLFGVFEFPVPGIIPSATNHHEGLVGAFNTGIIATVIGTPCLAPFVSSVFLYCLTQPPFVVYIMFTSMALGMASPFLLTAVLPSLVNKLPRPGEWMVKFKQFTGFFMLGTAVFLIFSIPLPWQAPLLVILLAVALFIWMCANLTSGNDGSLKTTRRLVYAALTSTPVLALGIWLLVESPVTSASSQSEQPNPDAAAQMPWQEFSKERVVQWRSEGKGMLIDFTANWCVLCKINEKVALDRQETIAFVKQHDFIPIMADFTRENEEILEFLRRFGQDSVPLTIIIPPGKESKIIALRGAYSLPTLLNKLRESVDPVPEQVVLHASH